MTMRLVGNMHGGKINIKGNIVRSDFIDQRSDNETSRRDVLLGLKNHHGNNIEGKIASIGGNRYIVKNDVLVPIAGEERPNIEVMTLRTILGGLAPQGGEINYGQLDGALRLAWFIPGCGAILIYAKGLRFAAKIQYIRLGYIMNFNINAWMMKDEDLWNYMKNEWGGSANAFSGSILDQHREEVVPPTTTSQQEIHSPQATSTVKEDKPNEYIEKECVVCLGTSSSQMILPCRHVCMCRQCTLVVQGGNSLCPMCRSHIHSIEPYVQTK